MPVLFLQITYISSSSSSNNQNNNTSLCQQSQSLYQRYRSAFADFPYLHFASKPEAIHLGYRLRIRYVLPVQHSLCARQRIFSRAIQHNYTGSVYRIVVSLCERKCLQHTLLLVCNVLFSSLSPFQGTSTAHRVSLNTQHWLINF